MIGIIKTEIFEQAMKAYKIKDSDIEVFEFAISENPDRWPVIPQSGGFRKARIEF